MPLYKEEETQQEGDPLQAKKSALARNQSLPEPWSWTLHLRNSEKRNVYCLSHPCVLFGPSLLCLAAQLYPTLGDPTD